MRQNTQNWTLERCEITFEVPLDLCFRFGAEWSWGDIVIMILSLSGSSLLGLFKSLQQVSWNRSRHQISELRKHLFCSYAMGLVCSLEAFKA